jgi:hypothetical protein
MDTRSQIVAAMIIVGLLLLAFPLLKSLWARFTARPSTVADSSAIEFGSDDPPPSRTIAFNTEILKACGRSLTPEQKLKMLTTEGVTKAKALEFARTTLEDSLSPPEKST